MTKDEQEIIRFLKQQADILEKIVQTLDLLTDHQHELEILMNAHSHPEVTNG